MRPQSYWNLWRRGWIGFWFLLSTFFRPGWFWLCALGISDQIGIGFEYPIGFGVLVLVLMLLNVLYWWVGWYLWEGWCWYWVLSILYWWAGWYWYWVLSILYWWGGWCGNWWWDACLDAPPLAGGEDRHLSLNCLSAICIVLVLQPSIKPIPIPLRCLLWCPAISWRGEVATCQSTAICMVLVLQVLVLQHQTNTNTNTNTIGIGEMLELMLGRWLKGRMALNSAFPIQEILKVRFLGWLNGW